jgi:hypothetical protein
LRRSSVAGPQDCHPAILLSFEDGFPSEILLQPALWFLELKRMIPKSGNRFSGKIMRRKEQ